MDNQSQEDTQEIYQSRVEMLGVDSADFVLENATFIRIQIMVKGKVKVIPTDLVESIAKLIQNYELSQKEIK